jgi:DNA-binding response OmpR family regulator
MSNFENDPYIKKFLEQQQILIVDPSASFGLTLVATLTEMGAPTHKVLFSKKYDDAKQMINDYNPKILITEYFVGQKLGLSLIEQQGQQLGEANKISIMITHNSSTSSIAEAAEEHVDDYILKPFSKGQMKARLADVIRRKMNPSTYSLKIREGKKFLFEKEFAKAELEFLEAMKLSEKPTLAHYYVGYSKFLQKNFATALQEFRSGRLLQPLHFKCLVGEFDSYFEQKKYEEAFKLSPILMENYPVSPKRLSNIIIAAVFSNHHEQIPKYYDAFKAMDHKTPELIKVFSAALMTAGKYQLKKNNLQMANLCFEMILSVAGSDVNYLDQIIRELLKVNVADLAAKYLTKFPSSEYGLAPHARLGFLIDCQLLPRHLAIEKRQKTC